MPDDLFPNSYQLIIQAASILVGLLTFILALTHVRTSATWIMILVCLYTLHLGVFYTIRFYALSHGIYHVDLFSDWSTLLRFHTTTTLFALTYVSISHRKMNGH